MKMSNFTLKFGFILFYILNFEYSNSTLSDTVSSVHYTLTDGARHDAICRNFTINV